MAENATHGFTRRSFIKGAAALTATGALVGCSPQAKNLEETDKKQEAPETKIYSGVCRGNCAGGCFLNVHVRDGQVVRTSARDLPNPSYNRICPRGLSHVGRIYSAERIKYPMKRTGEKGSREFERISWDEAIDTIVEKWKGYTAEFGNNAMAVMHGSGNYGVCSGQGIPSATSAFMNIMNCSNIPTNVDAEAGYAVSTYAGYDSYTSNNEPADLENSKTIICWGANPVVSAPQVMHFILEARDKGSKYIVIDPVYNANAAKADWFIPLKASTDGALAMGILHEVLEKDWVDIDFVRNHTEAPFLIKEGENAFLRMSDLGVEPTEGPVNPMTGKPSVVDPIAVWDASSNTAVSVTEAKNPEITGVHDVNGIVVKTAYDLIRESVSEYTVDAASALTGVPAEDIRELARIYAQEGPVNTYMALGQDHYGNGHYNYWPIYVLGAFTGQVGKPGAATGPVQSFPLIGNFAGVSSPVDSSGNACKGAGTGLLINEVANILETGKFKGEDFPLKGCYITNANPLVTMADYEETKRWLTEIEFLVVADMCLTETARYADILLPAAHWFEQNEMYTSFGTHPYLLWQEKATDPLFESKPDFQIYKLILDKMGYGDFFRFESEEDFVSLWLDTEGAKAMGITLDAMKEQKAVRFLPGEPYTSYKDGKYMTASGRLMLYQEKIVPQYSVGQEIDESKERTLYWEQPREIGEGNPIRETYPFHLLSDHMRTRTHTQWWDVGYMKEYEPEPVLRINPVDASEYGIVDGDKVKVYNDRGYVVMIAALHAGLPKGMVSSPRSFQVEEFIEGHFASLCGNEFNQIVANQAFNDVAVAIEKL